MRSKALFLMGRPEEGLKAMAECAFAFHSGELGRAWREGGREGGLKKQLEITGGWREATVQAWRRAVWKVLLDDTEGALDEIGKARELRNVDGLRGDPKFTGVLEGMSLTASQVSSR